jgi:hypothetical protein
VGEKKNISDHNTFRENPLEGTQNVINRKSQNVLHWMDTLHKACYKISPNQDLSLLTKRFKNDASLKTEGETKIPK